MAYKFKRQIFSFLDLIRFTKLVPNRKKMLEEGSSAPLPTTDDVTETMKILHPGHMKGTLLEKKEVAPGFYSFLFTIDKPLFFESGSYVTLGHEIGTSYASRPYAIASSPFDALREKRIELMIKKAGFFSTYMIEEAKVADVFDIHGPFGDFSHESLRDHDDVVALAGGSGIAPFISMARSLKEGSSSGYRLHIFYGTKTLKDIAYKDELDTLSKEPNIDVTYVLEEKTEGYPQGYIDRKILSEKAPKTFTAFVSGPNQMIAFAKEELASLGLEAKDIIAEPNPIRDRPGEGKSYKLTVHIQDQVYEIEAKDTETVLVALERAAIKAPSACRAGGCGYCHARLIKGKFTIWGGDKRRLSDAKFGYFHPCVSFPDSDLEIDVPPAK